MSDQNLGAAQGSASDSPGYSPEKQDLQPLLIGVSASTRQLQRQAEIVGPHLRLATLEGEAGSGKHSLAKLLFRHWVEANCTWTKPEFKRRDAREWLLSEPVAGAPKFVYLERVDLLSAPGQAAMLRILKVLNLGAAPAGAIAASSESSLRELAARNQFLPELAFRLTSVRFSVPPLRERREDIIPLANHFLETICNRYGLPLISLAPDAISYLLECPWPGNVRELSTVLESAILESPGSVIRFEDLSIRSVPTRTPQITPGARTLNLDDVIRNHVLYVLDLNHGNKLRAARQLGISRSTLYRMLENFLPCAHSSVL